VLPAFIERLQRHSIKGTRDQRVGQIHTVMTPISGLGSVVAEDWLDKNVARRVAGALQIIDF
jgi:hypothetical protein